MRLAPSSGRKSPFSPLPELRRRPMGKKEKGSQNSLLASSMRLGFVCATEEKRLLASDVHVSSRPQSNISGSGVNKRKEEVNLPSEWLSSPEEDEEKAATWS